MERTLYKIVHMYHMILLEFAGKINVGCVVLKKNQGFDFLKLFDL